ncbi:PASTA domain-containing protein [Streptomyces sp. HUCO-GS316]|uniref:PASTA domain-containing protein n=1 Tax=Streptomyces sp. HUCO-GS316 TaxID=2692198 RepID=UPI00301C958A
MSEHEPGDVERVEIDLPPEPDVTGTDPDDKGGTEQVTVSQVRGLSETEATQRLKDQGFAVETMAVDDPDVDFGFAAGTEPEGGGTAAAGSTVTLLIATDSSTGPSLVDVPSMVGWSQADAEQAIRDAGLVPSVVPQAASAEEAGIVIDQNPAGGPAETGSTVTLTVGQATTEGGSADGGTAGGTGTDAGTDAGTGA